MAEFIPLRMKYTDSGLASGIQELAAGETIDVGYFVASVSSLHSSLSALDEDDHPQYLLSATYALSSDSFQSSYETVLNNSGSWGGGSTALSALTDVSSALLPAVGDNLVWNGTNWGASADAGGGGATDHGALTGLSDDDHPQYVLSATNDVLSSLVTSIETSTVDLSSYISTNESAWSADNDTTDHTALSNIGTNSHADIDSHIASSTVHFTEASIDHGSIAGLADDDHTQYLLATGTRDADKLTVTGTLGVSGATQFGSTLSGTGAITTLGNVVVGGTVDGRDVAADGTKLDGIESGATADQTAGEIEAIVNHDNLVGFVAGEHFTEASIDHGSIAGLADNDHPQYVLSATNNTLSSNVSNHIASASVHQPAHYCFAYTSAVHGPVGTGWEQVSGFGTDFVKGYGSPGWALTDTETLRLPGAGTYELEGKVIVDKSDGGVGTVDIRFTSYSVSHTSITNSEGRGAIKGSNTGGTNTFIIYRTADVTPDIGVQLRMSDITVTAPVRGVAVKVTKLSDETA